MTAGKRPSFATLAVRAGQRIDPATGAHSTPIYQTSTYQLQSVEFGGRLTESGTARDSYSRAGNPTVRAAEEKLAALENAEAAVAFGSGMGAIAGVFLSHLRPGDEVLTLGPVYSDTHTLLTTLLAEYGVASRRVEPHELATAVAPNTKLVYVETPGNPTLSIVDLAAVAATARRLGVLTVADNTFSSPFITRPLELGIDMVVHSATKYLGGHGDLLAGFAAGSSELMAPVRMTGLRLIGASLDPLAAFLLLRGMRTLHLRVAAHSANAAAIAEALLGAPGVSRVLYPGLPQHPGHDVARRQMSAFGGMVSLDFASGRAGAKAFIERLIVFDHAVSLGDVMSLACVSSTTTHVGLTPQQRARDGISDGLVRLSVGVEDEADLVADVLQAAEAAALSA
ncbi:MAG TPA: PLP-dependent aspartate aminotransferase family protein [Trueperaceae bacterium]|nr:PLP-dependent aspartate aminotransferase family protein [Trueperaceae bacterium]